MIRSIFDVSGVEVEVVFRSGIKRKQTAEFGHVGKVAAEFETMVAAIPGEVIVKLMLLLNRFLRHVAVATDCKAVRERKQIQVCRCVNAVIERLILIGELVNRSRT